MYSLLILNFIIPFVMILLGYLLKKYPVTDRNSGSGYNTPASRSSQGALGLCPGNCSGYFSGTGHKAWDNRSYFKCMLVYIKVPVVHSLLTGIAIGVIF